MEKVIATPTIKTKKGNIISVGVHPFHFECLNAGYTYSHVPGLFTNIIPAIVKPLNTSSEISLSDLATLILYPALF
jgi:hypothetical protein